MFAGLVILFSCGDEQIGGSGEQIFCLQNSESRLSDLLCQPLLGEETHIGHLACAAAPEFRSGGFGEVPTQTVGGGEENTAGFE